MTLAGLCQQRAGRFLFAIAAASHGVLTVSPAAVELWRTALAKARGVREAKRVARGILKRDLIAADMVVVVYLFEKGRRIECERWSTENSTPNTMLRGK
ncbi:hypothetical protein GQ54DRAFT_178255 [Martensiomyces pterosporus]|nr:hypothetical protein GQ54DRAFT_178255 [Martensiomyces pterosporus]